MQFVCSPSIDISQDCSHTEDSPSVPTLSFVPEHSQQTEEPVLTNSSTAIPCYEVFHKTKHAQQVSCSIMLYHYKLQHNIIIIL